VTTRSAFASHNKGPRPMTTYTLNVTFDDAGLPLFGHLSGPDGTRQVDRSAVAKLLGIALPRGRAKGDTMGQPIPSVIPAPLASLLKLLRQEDEDVADKAKTIRASFRDGKGRYLPLADSTAAAAVALNSGGDDLLAECIDALSDSPAFTDLAAKYFTSDEGEKTTDV
jgi:hypothetical protein